MDNPEPKYSASESPSSNDEPFAWTNILHPKRHQDTDQEKTDKNKPAKPRYGAKDWLSDLWKSGADRHIELLLTLVIAAFAITQWYTVWRNNDSTTQQTERLITAAKISAYTAQQNARAARDFSDSARSMSQGVNDAVDRLGSQTRATEEARKSSVEQSSRSLQATIDNFQLDQRAWIGIQSIDIRDAISYPPEDPNVMRTADTAGQILKVDGISISIVNSGKTPATITEFSGEMEVGINDPHKGIFTSYARIAMSTPQPVRVLIPSQTMKGEFSGVRQIGTIGIYPMLRVKASIIYQDFWGKAHTTKVCFSSSYPLESGKYIFCPEPDGNSEN